MNADPHEEALFLELVLVFQQSAWIALGKIQNPQTGQVEVDLKGASHAIDMLAMLKSRTQSSLSAAERAIIDNALTQLRLNYVAAASEEADKQAGAKGSGDQAKASEKADGKPDA